ncbi:MAG: transposase [Clostridia bacterium]|nr:transposase [Clostridia bacterium]
MSRPPRVLSETGLYHIIFRGINHQNLFEDNQDYEKLLEIIEIIKKDEKFEIYAYCLMTNHVHMFIKEQNMGDIKKIVHKILTRYVAWYNHKYKRSGSLIGNRYKSEPIEDDVYYLSLIRYIHQNPVKAGIVKCIDEYKWSSYNDYIKLSQKLINIKFALDMLSGDRSLALALFKELHNLVEEIDFSISNTKKLSDEQLRRKIYKLTKLQGYEISTKPKSERNEVLSLLRRNGFTIGQLERLTGISRGIISRT